jgi:hypothetical protein
MIDTAPILRPQDLASPTATQIILAGPVYDGVDMFLGD